MIKETIHLSYTVKNKDGYLEDVHRQFSSTKAAYIFLVFLKKNVTLIGKPILESRTC